MAEETRNGNIEAGLNFTKGKPSLAFIIVLILALGYTIYRYVAHIENDLETDKTEIKNYREVIRMYERLNIESERVYKRSTTKKDTVYVE